MRDKCVGGRRYEGLELDGKIISHMRLSECTFVGCSVLDCSLGGCTFEDCAFEDCHVARPRSQGSLLRACSFAGCSLDGVQWDVWWPEPRLGVAVSEFSDSRLDGNSFEHVSVRGVSFGHSAVTGSSFCACDLRDCDFSGCDLASTEFADCRMQRADLRGAHGYRLSLLRNRIQGARFSYPDCLALLEGTGAIVEDDA